MLAGGLVWFGVYAGRFLIVNDPQRADVIVVLAGETDRRPARAVELLDQGYAKRVLIDVPAAASNFGFSQIQLAEKYIQQLPEAASMKVCPIVGLSTKEEAREVQNCLLPGEERVLVVTSDFHTRRALSIFRREIPGRTLAVAAAYDPTQFGAEWWTHRQWAKTLVDEWLRLIWWSAIERWH